MLIEEGFLTNNKVEIWANSNIESNTLLAVVDNVIVNKKNIISVPNKYTSLVWSWVENKNIKIYSRICFEDFNDDRVIEFIEETINKGAFGIQLKLKLDSIQKIQKDYLNIFTNSLFVKKLLSIVFCLDVSDVIYWDEFFNFLNVIQASSVCIYFNNEEDVFLIGRIYSFLNSWNFKGELHIKTKNEDLMESIKRLIEKIQPNIRYCFFVDV